MELNQCINFLLTKAHQTVLNYFRARLQKFDVTPVQYAILSCLWIKNERTATQIAQELSLDGSTITGILDRMANKGLIKREPDPNDRRAIRVVLTEKGIQLREPIERTIELTNQSVLDILSREEQGQFVNHLEKIIDGVNKL
ncbi:MAG: MarR family transcriptional regulator [Peptococcaceae bacterium]|jgi:DNA-binding MarR family transcriptional regulator|nr:MarR family transcriptional regulator [Peptococcaceae bacterium]